MKITDPISASMEPLVQANADTDVAKQALRNMIRTEMGPVKEPAIHMMASLEDKLCVLLDEGVLYFRPD